MYAVGRLALFAPAGSRRRVDPALAGLAEALAGGARYGRIAIANPELAPVRAGRARGARSRRAVGGAQGRIVLGENVNQTAQFALTGGVEAAFIPYSIVRRAGLQRSAGAR